MIQAVESDAVAPLAVAVQLIVIVDVVVGAPVARLIEATVIVCVPAVELEASNVNEEVAVAPASKRLPAESVVLV